MNRFYLDTSLLVKLYVLESDSEKIIRLLSRRTATVFINDLHKTEVVNAFNLKLFRREISQRELRDIIAKFQRDEKSPGFIPQPINWDELIKQTSPLSLEYTRKTGSRTLDIMHIAAALQSNCDRFHTNDKRQKMLAGYVGLKTGGISS